MRFAILNNGVTKKEEVDPSEIARRKNDSLSIYGSKSTVSYRPFTSMYKKFTLEGIKKD